MSTLARTAASNGYRLARRRALTWTVLIAACGGGDATGTSANSSVTISAITCVQISDDQFFRGYRVTANGTAQGPVGAILTPGVGQGTGPTDPNRSGEAITVFTTQWTLPGSANVSDKRASGDPETTTITIQFETSQVKPVQAMSVFASLDLFLPDNAGRKDANKTTTCQ